MVEKDGEDLAAVLEQALAEAEARARDRATAAPTPEQTRPTAAEAARRSGSGLHQVDESGLPPVRRSTKPQARSIGEMLRDELPNGRAWEIGWIILRELGALVGLFWIALIGVSFVAPDGGLGLDVLPLTVAVTVVLRLIILAVGTFLPDR